MSNQATVQIEERAIPTYAPGPEFSIPMLGALQREELYPYSSQTDISTESTPQRHRVVVLENEYLRAEILPDLGGRLYRLFDKIARTDAFEFQASIKPQHIGARGAWISGGIEFNYGFPGHTVNTFAPVTWAIRQDADGGASVWVGALIMPVESRWSVRIRLRPGRAALDNEIRVMSPQALPALMYWWSNAGVQVSEKSEFFYFGPAGTGGDRHSWPIAEGVDMRWWKNRVNQNDMFLLQCQRNAMGFYDHGREHGVACSGDRFDAPGEKYFTWGTDMHGRAFDTLLSDAGHSYCEIQRGRDYSQGDSDRIAAMTEDVWAESWIPLRRTQGLSDDCPELVLHVVQGAGEATVNLQGLQVLTDLSMEAESQGVTLGRAEIARLAPEDLFSKSFAVPAATHLDRIRIRDAAGRVLLDWKEYVASTEDWVKPGRSDRLAGIDTADRLFAQAEAMRFRNWPRPNAEAQRLYERVLGLDPFHVGTLQALAEADFFCGQNQDALDKAEKALPRTLNDPDLLALKGWALFRLGRLDDALEAFGWAGRNEHARRKGLFGVALVQLKQGNVRAAGHAADRILAGNPTDKWGRLLRAALCRKAGETAEAKSIVQGLLAVDPLWNRVHAEALLLGVAVGLHGDTRRIGDDSVSAAGLYLDLGWWEDAETVLSVDESNERFSPANRLAHLLFVQHQLGKTKAAAKTLQALRAAPTEMAHAWTTQSIAVLEALAAREPAEAMIHFLRGNILASRRRAEEATAAWKHAAELGLAAPVLLANLARTADLAKEPAAARNLYERAAAAAPADLGIWLEYDRFLAARGLREERAAAFARLPRAVQQRTLPMLRRVEQLLDLEAYPDAVRELTARRIARGEGDGAVLLLHFEGALGLALARIEEKQYDEATSILRQALTYPENLSLGRMGANPNEAMVHYFLGLVAELAGNAAEARKHWETAAIEPAAVPSLASSYVVLANKILGRAHTARGLARQMELYTSGMHPIPPHQFYFHTSRRVDVQSGLLSLARGHVNAARKTWEQGLADWPDTRLLRLHLRIPRVLLERMAGCP